jgi:hypothetical protein
MKRMIKKIDTDALSSWNREQLDDLSNEENESYCNGYESAIDNVADWLNQQSYIESVNGHWKDINEVQISPPGIMSPLTNTSETCSVCKARIGLVGPKKYIYDKRCPSCGAFMS